VELVADIVHDPDFGSLVMLGVGDARTEFFGDRGPRSQLTLRPLWTLRRWQSFGRTVR
jgi:hypothetical protein